MVVFLFKLIFFTINSLTNVISRAIFTTTAFLVVLFIQAFKVPGEAVQGALEQLGEAIKSFFEYVLELIMELISNLISTAFEFLVNSITDSASTAGSAIGGLAEKTRTSLEGLLADLPELAEGFSEMVSNMVSDLWNNYLEALGYVQENA